MRKKEKIYLVAQSYASGGNYKVKKLVDSLRFNVGDKLSKAEVLALIDNVHNQVTITITEK